MWNQEVRNRNCERSSPMADEATLRPFYETLLTALTNAGGNLPGIYGIVEELILTTEITRNHDAIIEALRRIWASWGKHDSESEMLLHRLTESILAQKQAAETAEKKSGGSNFADLLTHLNSCACDARKYTLNPEVVADRFEYAVEMLMSCLGRGQG